VNLFSKISNVYDHDTSTSQFYRQTDGPTTWFGNTALCYASRDKNQPETETFARRAQRRPPVMGHVTSFATCHFLLVVHWNPASISNRFQDIRPQHMLTNYTNTLTNTHTHTHTDTLTNKHDESQYLLAEVITIDSMSNFEMIVNAKTRVFSEE